MEKIIKLPKGTRNDCSDNGYINLVTEKIIFEDFLDREIDKFCKYHKLTKDVTIRIIIE